MRTMAFAAIMSSIAAGGLVRADGVTLGVVCSDCGDKSDAPTESSRLKRDLFVTGATLADAATAAAQAFSLFSNRYRVETAAIGCIATAPVVVIGWAEIRRRGADDNAITVTTAIASVLFVESFGRVLYQHVRSDGPSTAIGSRSIRVSAAPVVGPESAGLGLSVQGTF